MLIDVSEIKKTIKPKADSTLNNMRKADLIEYIRCLENNYNTAVWFNENQARYIERLGLDPESLRPKWISVEDRLPKNSTYVNVVTDGVVAQAYWRNGKFYAFTAIGVATVGGVTHWMPLPAAPDMRGDT